MSPQAEFFCYAVEFVCLLVGAAILGTSLAALTSEIYQRLK